MSRWGGTPLRDAVRHGHEKIARVLKEHGGTLGFTEQEASGELCELARRGSLDVLKLMLQAGAQVDAADYDQRTCLHLAASEGNLPIIEYLTAVAKASTDAKDRWGGMIACAQRVSNRLCEHTQPPRCHGVVSS